MRRFLGLTLALLAIMSGNAYAEILIVPDEYPDLYSAGLAAWPDDTIGVQAGDHYASLAPIRSGVTLLGLDGDSSVVRILPSEQEPPLVCLEGSFTTIIESVEIRGAVGESVHQYILENYSNLTIRRCSLVAGFDSFDGMSLMFPTAGDLTIERCRISSAVQWEIVLVSGWWQGSGTLLVSDCLFVYAEDEYPPILIPTYSSGSGSQFIFQNCTIRWLVSAADHWHSDYSLEFVNCIVQELWTGPNCPPEPGDIPDTFELRYNDIVDTTYSVPCEQAGYQIGNFFADPLFCDAQSEDYRIQADSPCRGAGENGEDVGARLGYCYPPSEVSERQHPGSLPLTIARAFPNPATAAVTLELQTTPVSSGTFRVYDVAGSLVYRRWIPDLSNVRTLFWDGLDLMGRPVPAGSYIISLQSGGTQATRSVLIVR